MFGGEKVGEGVGRIWKEVKYNVVELVLLYLVSEYFVWSSNLSRW